MGFSSSLQGATSHDAILQRVDAELRLLENMKRCLTARVKGQLISEGCPQKLQTIKVIFYKFLPQSLKSGQIKIKAIYFVK